MAKLAAQLNASGLANPADPTRELPSQLDLLSSGCASAAALQRQFQGAVVAERNAGGSVRGEAWQPLARSGLVPPSSAWFVA